jgi:hypothetical protein
MRSCVDRAAVTGQTFGTDVVGHDHDDIGAFVGGGSKSIQTDKQANSNGTNDRTSHRVHFSLPGQGRLS